MQFRILVSSLAAALVVGAGQSVLADVPPVIQPGDFIPGLGTVQRLEQLTVNDSGDWIVEAVVGVNKVIIRNGELLYRVGDALSVPSGATIDDFDEITLNNNGQSAFNFYLNGVPSSQNSGLYFENALLLQEGQLSAATGFSGSAAYGSFYEVHLNDNDQILTVTGMRINGNTSLKRAIMRIDYDQATGVFTETVIAKFGDVLPGQVRSIGSLSGQSHQTAFNNAADVMFYAQLAGSDSSTNGVIYLNDVLLAQEGSASPIAGRIYEHLNERAMDLNDNGDYVFRANLTGPSSSDEVIILNGSIFKQEGETIATPEGDFQIVHFGVVDSPVYIGENGSVLWFAEWNNPDATINRGLFLDMSLVVQQGVTEINGEIIASLPFGKNQYALSPNGEIIITDGGMVPSPGSTALLVLGGLVTLGRRRRPAA